MWNFILSSVVVSCSEITLTNCERCRLMTEALWCGLPGWGRLGIILGIWNPFQVGEFQKDPLSLSGRTRYQLEVLTTGWLENCLPSLNDWIVGCHRLIEHNSKAVTQTAASSMSLLLDCSNVCRVGRESSGYSSECDYPTGFLFLPLPPNF